MKKVFISGKICKSVVEYMCRLFPPEKWLKDWIREKGGAVKLENNTWIDHQSEKFHNYCYSKGYDDFSNGT